ncbi:hypothetical protein MHYP_G00172840 [Metynnis hypsauchen]
MAGEELPSTGTESPHFKAVTLHNLLQTKEDMTTWRKEENITKSLLRKRVLYRKTAERTERTPEPLKEHLKLILKDDMEKGRKHHQVPPEEKSALQKDCRKNRKNFRTCERAPETDPQGRHGEQSRAQRKEDRGETRYWEGERLHKTLQAPPEEKSAPQRDSRKNGECLTVRTTEIVQS